MKVLITGSYGFLARNLSLYLNKKGIITYGIGHLKKKIKKIYGYDKCINGKITQLKLYKNFEKIDYLIHCAGTGKVIGFSKKINFYKNVTSTINILKFVKKSNPQCKIIFMSTASVYGNQKGILTENTKVNPISNYGKNKYLAEQFCSSFSKKYKLNILILRITSLYGNGLKKQFIYDACKKIYKKEKKFYGTGEEIRDWIHIDDMVNLIFKIIIKKFSGFKIINCGSGKGYKIKDVLKFIKKKRGSKFKPVFNNFGKNINPKKMITDITEAKKFNWSPQKVFWKGLSEYLDWFDKNYEYK